MYLLVKALHEAADAGIETARALYVAKKYFKNRTMTEFDLQKAMTGDKVMTKSRNYTGHYLLTLEGCPHVYVHVFKMNGLEGEKLVQVDDKGKCFLYCSDQVFGIPMGGPNDLIMAPEVKTVWVNFFLDTKNRILCTMPLTSETEVSAMDSTWRFIKTEKIVLEY